MNITTDLIATRCRYTGYTKGGVEKATAVYTIHGVFKPEESHTCCLVESYDTGHFYVLEYIKLKRHKP